MLYGATLDADLPSLRRNGYEEGRRRLGGAGAESPHSGALFAFWGSLGTLAHVVFAKFDHHLPLYRQVAMMAAQGLAWTPSSPGSFAQFEREVTGERIRDKIAASKRKGMWMGGTCVRQQFGETGSL